MGIFQQIVMEKGVLIIITISLLFLFPNLISAQIVFSEIMYHPPGNESKHEWVEVYNQGNNSINLSQWKLRENNDNHKLNLVQGNFMISPGDFIVIADNNQTFLLDYDFSGNLFDSAFSLNNNGEELALIDNPGFTAANLTYNPDLGADGNNKTLCLFNSSWQECLTTPGNPNLPYYNPENPDVPDDSGYPLSLSIYLKEPVYAGISYTRLFKISFKNKNCSQQDNVTVEYNLTGPDFSKTSAFSKKVGCSSYADTGEFSPDSAGNYLLCGKIVHSSSEENYSKDGVCKSLAVTDLKNISCDLSLTLNAEENLIYLQGQTIEFQPELDEETYPFSIDYWIEDLFGNPVKNKVTTTNTNQKSWKADIGETDRVLMIKAIVYPKCQDLNQSNNYVEKMLVVTNEDFDKESEDEDDGSGKGQAESEIKIIKIMPEDPTFGELVKAELEIYKGETGKCSVSAWAESNGKEISEKTKINLGTKFKTYKLAIPVQLDPNCDLKIKGGKAKIIVSGLDEKAEENIKVSGINKKLCSGKGDSKEPETKGTAAQEPKSAAKKSDSDKSSLFSSENQDLPTKAGTSSGYTLAASEKSLAEEGSGIVVYQSSSEKAKKAVLYLLIITLGLLSLVLVRGK